MEKEEVLRRFDKAVDEMEKKVKSLKEHGYVMEYVDKIKVKRVELAKALDVEDDEKSAEIIDLTIELGKEIDRLREVEEKKGLFGEVIVSEKTKKVVAKTEVKKGKVTKKEPVVKEKEVEKVVEKKKKEPVVSETKKMKVEKKKEKGFLASLFGGKQEKVEPSPRKEKAEVGKMAVEHKEWHDEEMGSIREELAKREVELEGLKGAYAKMSADMGEMREKMEVKQAEDVKDLTKQMRELKNTIDGLHTTMRKEFAASKEAYKGFGMEMLHLAIKVSEIEELVETGDTITEVDVLELYNAVGALERKLSVIEAQEKKRRLEFIEQIEKEQKKMLKKLKGKADTQKIVSAIKQYVSELKHEIDERDTKIAAEMHVELKSSYYTLSEKVKKIETALEKAKSKKDLKAIHKKVEDLSKNIEKVRDNEFAIERELEQQHLSDEALLQKIEHVGERLKKSKEMDSVAMGDIYKTIEALEMELKARPGTKDVKSMRGSLNALKTKMEKMEEDVLVCGVCGKKCKNSRGLFLHKKMAHRKPVKKNVKAVKKKAAKKGRKKATKKGRKKKKKLFGIIGG